MVDNRIFENIRSKVERGIVNPAFNALLDHALKPITEKLEKAFFEDFNHLKQRALAYGEYDSRYMKDRQEKGLEMELVKDHLMSELKSFNFASPIAEVDLENIQSGKLTIEINGVLKELNMEKEEDRNIIRDRVGAKEMRVLPGDPPRLSRPNFVNYLKAWTPDKQVNESDLEMIAHRTGRPIILETTEGRKVLGPKNNREPLFMKHQPGDTENIGHYLPMIRDERGNYNAIEGLPNTGNACGIESILYITKREELLSSGMSTNDADIQARLNLNEVGIRENFIDSVRDYAFITPGLRDNFLGRSHESGVIGGGPFFQKAGGRKADILHCIGVDNNSKPIGITLESEDAKLKRALTLRDVCNQVLKALIEDGMIQTLVEVTTEGEIKSVSIYKSGASPITDKQIEKFKESVLDFINRRGYNKGVYGQDIIEIIKNISVSTSTNTPRGNKQYNCALDNSAQVALEIINRGHIVVGGELPVTKELQSCYTSRQLQFAYSCSNCDKATDDIVGTTLPKTVLKKNNLRIISEKVLATLLKNKTSRKSGNVGEVYTRGVAIETILSYEEGREGINKILELRLKELKDSSNPTVSNIDLLVHVYKAQVISYNKDQSRQIRDLSNLLIATSTILNHKLESKVIFNKISVKKEDASYKVMGEMRCKKDYHVKALIPLLLPETEDLYHWVGLVVEKLDEGMISINYLDSDNHKLIDMVDRQYLLDQGIVINKFQVEEQRYNNCGPEVIENFVYYLTGSRATQEAAVYLHSLLLENTLLNPEIYKLKIEENNKLIKFLSNNGPMPMQYTPIGYEERLIVIMEEINQSFRLANSDSSSKMIMEETYDSMQFQGEVVASDVSTAHNENGVGKLLHALNERIIKLDQERDDRAMATIMQEDGYHRVEIDDNIQQISDRSSALLQPNYESSQESDSQFILIGEQVKVGIPGNNRQEHSAVALIAGGVEEGIVPITTLVIIDTNGHYRSDNTGVSPKSGFIGYLANLAEEFVTSVSSRAMSIGNTMTNGIMKNEYIKGKILNYVYYEEVVGVNSVISKEYVQGSTNSGVQEVLKKHPFTWDKKDFKKLKLVVHPDKGGNAEDFRAINGFEDQIGKTERIYENIYQKLAEKLQPKVQKVSIYAKGADLGIDLAKVYLNPNIENSLNTIYDGIVLCNKVSPNVLGASVVMVTTPITSLYNLYQGDYEKAGIQGINGLSYYMLNSKYLPGYGLHAYAGLNGITIAYDVYKGEYLEAGLQTIGIAGMVFAPTLTGAYYAIRYTYNNAHGLYQLYQAKQQENILGFNNIIARLLVKTINDNIHDKVIQNILRSISLDQRLEEAGIKEEVAIISNEYNEREGIALISLEDIAGYLKDKNKVVIRQINNLDATKLIKEKVDKLINKRGVLNYLKEYVGYASDGISETKKVESSESIKLEIMQLLGKKDVNYDEVEVIIKNAIDVIKSKYLSNLYDSTVNNEVLKVLKEIEEEVLVVKDKDRGREEKEEGRDKGSKEYYTEEVSRMIVGKDGEGITITEVSPYKQLTGQTSEEQSYCNRISKENEENKIYESIKCIRKDLDIADITNNKLHLPMMMGLDEAVADILIDSKNSNNNSKDNNKDVLYYWNKEHKTKLEKALINLSNNGELINNITKKIEESKSWIIPQSIKQEIITEEYIKEKAEKELSIVGSVMNYGKSFFVSDNRSLNDRLEEYLVSKVTDKSKESDVATMIKIMSVNKEGCYMHGYILDSYAEVIDHETVKSNNSELCNNEISNYINKGDMDA